MTDESRPMSDRTIPARHNPQPTQAYKITLTIGNAPGPFAMVEGTAQYDVLEGGGCLPPADSQPGGVPASARTNELFVLTKVSDTQYEGIIYTDLMHDEDYFGRGVCHWQLMDVRARLRATGDESETRFVPDLDVAPESVLAEQTRITYFLKEDYPRNPRTENYAQFGTTNRARIAYRVWRGSMALREQKTTGAAVRIFFHAARLAVVVAWTMVLSLFALAVITHYIVAVPEGGMLFVLVIVLLGLQKSVVASCYRELAATLAGGSDAPSAPGLLLA